MKARPTHRKLDNSNVESSIQAKSKDQAEKVWAGFYPREPFELKYISPSDDTVYASDGPAGDISYKLVGPPTMHDPCFLEEALARYKGFLYLIQVNQDKGVNFFRVPT